MYRIQNSKTKNFKRMVVMSDLHCAHQLGLTPPSWQYDKDNKELESVSKRQREAWDWYVNTINLIGEDIDILVVNGDCIDGPGKRNGGVELITTDMLQQCNMAIECIKQWSPKSTIIISGTEYHTGNAEQFEEVIAERLGAEFHNQVDIKVNGKIFNFRHKVGSSGVPYGKSTQVIKEAIWQQLKKQYFSEEVADVIIRSHVHYMNINQDSMRYSITTPALQLNSRYGIKQCSGYTDFGFLVFDIYNNGKIDIKPYIADIKEKQNIIEV